MATHKLIFSKAHSEFLWKSGVEEDVEEWKVWSVLAHGSSDACLVMAGYGPLRFCCWTRDVKLSDRMSFWQMSSNLCLEEDQTLKGVGCSFEIDQKEWMKQKGRMAWTHLKPLRESETESQETKSTLLLDYWTWEITWKGIWPSKIWKKWQNTGLLKSKGRQFHNWTLQLDKVWSGENWRKFLKEVKIGKELD